MNENTIPPVGHLKITMRPGSEGVRRVMPRDVEVTVDGAPLPRNWCGLTLSMPDARTPVTATVTFYPESIEVDSECLALLASEMCMAPDPQFLSLLTYALKKNPDLLRALTAQIPANDETAASKNERDPLLNWLPGREIRDRDV